MLTCRCVQTVAEGVYWLAVDPVIPTFRRKLYIFYKKAVKKNWWRHKFDGFLPNAVFVSSVSGIILLSAIIQSPARFVLHLLRDDILLDL